MCSGGSRKHIKLLCFTVAVVTEEGRNFRMLAGEMGERLSKHIGEKVRVMEKQLG